MNIINFLKIFWFMKEILPLNRNLCYENPPKNFLVIR